jgi:ABC-type Zn2+ transport system substrate-binding protein/surface adhesin
MLETILVTKTIQKKITKLTTGIIPLFDSQTDGFQNVVSKSIIIDNLTGFSNLPSLQAVAIPNWRLNENELNKQYRTLDVEFNSYRKQLNIYIGRNNEWQKIGVFSLINPSAYPYKFFNLLDFISSGEIAKFQSGYTIGLEVEDVGFGLLGENDFISVKGSYTEQYTLGNTDLVKNQEPIAIEDIVNLQDELDGKSPTNHGHSIANIENLQATLDAKAIASEVSSALAGKSPTNHGHSIANVENLQGTLDAKAIASEVSSALAGKSPTNHGHLIANIENLQATLDAKAIASEVSSALAGKSPTNHGHLIANIENLQATLDAKAIASEVSSALAGKSPTNHGHLIANIENLQATLDAKAIASEVNSALAGKSPTNHGHSIANIENLQATLDAKAFTSDVNTALGTKASLYEIIKLQIALEDKVSRNNYLPIVRSIYEPDNSFPLGAIWHEMGGIDSNIANLQRTWIKNTWIKEYLTLDNASGYFWISQNQYSFDLPAPSGSTPGNVTNAFPLNDSYNYCFSHLLVSGFYAGAASVTAADYWKMTISTQISAGILIDTGALPSNGFSKNIPINKIFSFVAGERLAFNQVKVGSSSAVKIGACLRYHLIRK